jgi:hypothetical protein
MQKLFFSNILLHQGVTYLKRHILIAEPAPLQFYSIDILQRIETFPTPKSCKCSGGWKPTGSRDIFKP